MRALILHGFSAANLGDGLLVTESVGLVREALGDDCEIVVAAQYPETFVDVNASFVSTAPTKSGYSRAYLRTLRTLGDFDLVVAVGGGYLRAGTPVETAKTLLVHGPQLLVAARHRSRAVYLPQSVGPLRFGTRPIVRALAGRLNTLMLRDDRSIAELKGVSGARRLPDLALASLAGPRDDRAPDSVPVLTIRAVHGAVPSDVLRLAPMLSPYDTFIQSFTGGNDDRPATAQLDPRRVLTSEELMDTGDGSAPRVVVAVRLHAALMALRAGHYVVHLAYERKGFGAFTDVGLPDYVHNVNGFSPEKVLAQVTALVEDPHARERYRNGIASTRAHRDNAHADIVAALRRAADR